VKVWESVRVALRALSANKLRAILTMLGITIGVGAVITLMSAGEGVSVYIANQLQGVGSNLLIIMPGSLDHSSGPPMAMMDNNVLTVSDVRALEDPTRAPDVEAVSAELVGAATVKTAKRESSSSTVHGVMPNFTDIRSWQPVAGRTINQEDMNGRARVAVLGRATVDTLFPENPYPIDESIKINGVPFRIVGVLEEKGGSQFGNEDDTVLVPLTTAQTHLFSGRSRSGGYRVSVIMAQAVSQERMDAASEEITAILRDQHKIDFAGDDDFSVISQADLIQVFGEITSVLTIFLGAIAGISLLVGGIGIMNIMLVSVTERTREIGLRKAVGARRQDILLQFLIEAVSLSFVGGTIGVIIGVAGAELISSLVEGFSAVVTPKAVILATTFSVAVGLFFGIYPARRASLLNPIEALRYE